MNVAIEVEKAVNFRLSDESAGLKTKVPLNVLCREQHRIRKKMKSLYIRTTKCPNRHKNLDY